MALKRNAHSFPRHHLLSLQKGGLYRWVKIDFVVDYYGWRGLVKQKKRICAEIIVFLRWGCEDCILPYNA
jgi:hypothetical protein